MCIQCDVGWVLIVALVADDSKAEGNLITLSSSGLSLSMASLYSNLELQKANSTLENTVERSARLAQAHKLMLSLSNQSGWPNE